MSNQTKRMTDEAGASTELRDGFAEMRHKAAATKADAGGAGDSRVEEEARGKKAKAGRGLLWAGSVVLMGEAAFLWMQLNAIWENSGARTLGWGAAAGATIQRIMALLAWNDALLLAAAAKVLVLCCPLLAIAVGMGMLRKAQFAEESPAANAKAEEERR